MDWATSESCLTIPPFERQGIHFAIAGPEDDADVREILREVSMDGWVKVSMTREPEMSLAHRALGQFGEFLILREVASGKAICIGEYHTSSLFLNGIASTVPYIGALRVVPKWRNRISILRNGLDMVRQLQDVRGDPSFMLTSIAAENTRANRLLTANLAGMPNYHFIGRVVTLVLPVSRGRPSEEARPANKEDLPVISAALCEAGKQTQFMPVWDQKNLLQLTANSDLDLKDFRVMENDGKMTGALAVWDQRGFRQVLVNGYSPWVSRLRPVYNAFARIRRGPSLPRMGTALSQVTLSHFLSPTRETEAIDLVSEGLTLAREKGAETALLGLSADHPMLRVLRDHFRALTFETNLYLVSWKSGPPPPQLDTSRMLAPEAAVL